VETKQPQGKYQHGSSQNGRHNFILREKGISVPKLSSSYLPNYPKNCMKVLGNIAPEEETTQPKFLFDFSNSGQVFTISVDPFYSP
jgi:hypothetical protein